MPSHPQYLTQIPLAISIRERDSRGDKTVIEEVIGRDVYGLRDLYLSGFRPKTIFDIGAHIGCFSLLAHSYFPEASLYGFEPNLESYMLLLKNAPFAYNYHLAIDYGTEQLVYANAVGTEGSGFVAPAKDIDKFATAKEAHDGGHYIITHENVERATIEELVEFHGIKSIDLLKMDCEGSEWNIVEHLSPAVAAIVRSIKGEYHTFTGKKAIEFKSLIENKFPHLHFHFSLHAGETHGLFESY